MGAAIAAGETPNVRSWALYAVVTIALVALVGGLLALAFGGPRDAAAITLSAVVAVAVQLVAFAITKSLAGRHLVAGWGAGSLLRFVTLAVYALAAIKVLGLPPVAALVSLATFFFVSTLVEPLFLRR